MSGLGAPPAFVVNGGRVILMLAVAVAGCATRQPGRHSQRNTAVAPSAACRVCPDPGSDPQLDLLGGYHATRWYSIEPLVTQAGGAAVVPQSPALLPQEEVPTPDPTDRELEGDEGEGDSDRPDLLPGIRSSTSLTRDSWLTQTAWPAVASGTVQGVVRLPVVVEQAWQQPRNRIVR